MQNEKDTHKCTFFQKIYITMLNYPYICIQNVRQRMKLYGQSRGTPWQITYLYIYVAWSYMGRAEIRHGKKESLNRFRPTVKNKHAWNWPQTFSTISEKANCRLSTKKHTPACSHTLCACWATTCVSWPKTVCKTVYTHAMKGEKTFNPPYN